MGYNRKGVLHRTARVATLALGYADGFRRELGNGQWSVQVGGHLCPTIGNVCMDFMMIDVTDTSANVGDEVVVFQGNDIEKMAQLLRTIPYEILTSLSARLPRVFFED